MEEERKDIQETAEAAAADLPGVPDIPEVPDIPQAEAEPVREAPRRLNRNGKRSSEPRSLAARDVALMNMVEEVENERTKDYLENRIVPQMNWYSKKSTEYKSRYYNIMTVNIVLGALIPVFSAALTDGPLTIRIIIALLGTSVTAINAYLSLQNYRDLWLTYRATSENMRRTLYYFFNGVGVFSNGTQAEKDTRLIDALERELASENGTWRSIIENQSSGTDSHQTGSED